MGEYNKAVQQTLDVDKGEKDASKTDNLLRALVTFKMNKVVNNAWPSQKCTKAFRFSILFRRLIQNRLADKIGSDLQMPSKWD